MLIYRTTRKEQEPTAEDDRGIVIESKCNQVTPGPSGSGKSSSAQNENKTPKWFKQSFK